MRKPKIFFPETETQARGPKDEGLRDFFVKVDRRKKTDPLVHTVYSSKDELCYIFEKRAKTTITEDQVEKIKESLKKNKKFRLAFNTNGRHNVRFTLKDGGRVSWPIHFCSCWTANALIKKGLVKTIEIFPITKKIYEALNKYS